MPLTPLTVEWRHVVLATAVAVSAAVTFAQPPLAQWPEYHQMADVRRVLGIPNALNVLSNIPFAIVGVIGLAQVFHRKRDSQITFHDRWERWPYAAFFAGITLTCIGSAYYHLAPDNARLVWDRLPMTIAFMGLLAALITERIGIRFGRRLLVPLLVTGVSSVAYWYWTEARGSGDLRFYVLVQFGSLALVLLLLVLYRPKYPGSAYLFGGLVLYAVAKVFEIADASIYEAGRIVSGHTLKHLAAATGAAGVVMALSRRKAHEPSDVFEDSRGERRRAMAGAGR